jgi:hypothetical protein
MERTYIHVFRFFFVNFVSSYTRYVHDEPICTGPDGGLF